MYNRMVEEPRFLMEDLADKLSPLSPFISVFSLISEGQQVHPYICRTTLLLFCAQNVNIDINTLISRHS